MKILQTIGTLGAKQGGPSSCTYELMHSLNLMDAPVDLLTILPREIDNQVLGEGEAWLQTVPNDRKTPLCFSSGFEKKISETDYDLYHCNGMWIYPNHLTCKVAREKGKPYILSPHGMLYPSALKVSRWKKFLLLKLWFNKDVHSASCLHVTCQQEADYCRSFGYKGPIAVIPNPVVLPEYAKLATTKSLVNGRKQIGFLGRLHPIKKIEQVLYAMALLTKEELSQLSFQIMGKYDDQYEHWLKEEVTRLQLEDYVEFIGFVNGEEKYKRLQNLWALMVPSVQENFGMIVPEALICGTPVYASLGTPWGELNEQQCGWWKDNSPKSIATVLRDILLMKEPTCLEMGRRGRDLIEIRYRANFVAQKMWNLYKWIVEGGETPNFITL